MRNIPTVTKNLLIINILVFLASLLMGNLNDIFGLHFILSDDFQVYQLVTYMFMHGGWSHIFFNMFALWMFGCIVERAWGARKFLFYYLSCGVGAGLMQELAQAFEFYFLCKSQIPGFDISQMMLVADNSAAIIDQWTTVGASGAIYAILLAFGMIFPNEKIFIFPFPVPIKAKWLVIGYAAIELFQAMASPGSQVAHLAHLGGMIFGFFMIRYWNRHPSYGYGADKSKDFFESLRSTWEKRRQRTRMKSSQGGEYNKNTSSSTGNPDWDYNARKKAEQEEIDRILEKIRLNGYDSLTREEKQKLFDSSNKR